MALLDEHIDGKYEILEKLREGGMGAIYKVRHRLLDEIRVVKVIRSAVAGHPDAGERFLREARAAIRLRHPNIAALHDFAIAGDGNAYIIMEFIDGSTLQEILDRHGPPPLALTLEIARQSLRALGYLHRQKIVHRDVAPDNLMLMQDVDGHPFVKLIDLGIAKAFEESAAGLTSTGVFLGKPRYASPEQFSGLGVDARSDLYSFGMVLYELLTGRCPILGSDPASYLAGHLIRPPLPFAESDPGGRVPPALREIVLRTLAKKPEERYADAEELVWALTLIREEGLLQPAGSAELATLLGPPIEEKIVPFPSRPGSTQDRLDREFLLTQDPPAFAPFPRPAEPATVALSRPALLPPPLPPLPGPPPPAQASAGPSVLDDMTWVTAPVRRVDPELLLAPPPAAPAPPPMRSAGAQTARTTGSWTVLQTGLGLAAVLVLAAGGSYWWVRSQRTEPVPLLQEVEAAPDVATASTPIDPASSTSGENEESEAATEEFQAAARPPASPERREERKKVLPEEAAVAPADVQPMQRGALIRRGMPNVEVPFQLELPAYPYPEAARGTGRRVHVRVGILVDEAGKVAEVRLREGDSSGLGFNEIALETARKTPFLAATRDGVPGKMWTEMIFEFAEQAAR